jgi:hypothetical protein
VNDDSILKEIETRWQALGCNDVRVLCPAIACLQPVSASCLRVDGGSVGLCTNDVTLPVE